MSGILYHKPSQIVAKCLITKLLGTDPTLNQSWPIFNDHHAPEPDQLICVYDTDGIVQNQNHLTGGVSETYGIQLKVRGSSNSASFAKIMPLAAVCDSFVRESVTLDNRTYLIHAAARRSTILSLGYESNDNHLWLHTVNYTVSITLV